MWWGEIKRTTQVIETPKKKHDVAEDGGGKDDDVDEWDGREHNDIDDEDDDIDDEMSAFRTVRNTPTTLKLDRKPMRQRGYNRFSEFIVYDTKQIHLKYLVELTTREYVEREFRKKHGLSKTMGADDDDDDDTCANPPTEQARQAQPSYHHAQYDSDGTGDSIDHDSDGTGDSIDDFIEDE